MIQEWWTTTVNVTVATVVTQHMKYSNTIVQDTSTVHDSNMTKFYQGINDREGVYWNEVPISLPTKILNWFLHYGGHTTLGNASTFSTGSVIVTSPTPWAKIMEVWVGWNTYTTTKGTKMCDVKPLWLYQPNIIDYPIMTTTTLIPAPWATYATAMVMSSLPKDVYASMFNSDFLPRPGNRSVYISGRGAGGQQIPLPSGVSSCQMIPGPGEPNVHIPVSAVTIHSETTINMPGWFGPVPTPAPPGPVPANPRPTPRPPAAPQTRPAPPDQSGAARPSQVQGGISPPSGPNTNRPGDQNFNHGDPNHNIPGEQNQNTPGVQNQDRPGNPGKPVPSQSDPLHPGNFDPINPNNPTINEPGNSDPQNPGQALPIPGSPASGFVEGPASTGNPASQNSEALPLNPDRSSPFSMIASGITAMLNMMYKAGSYFGANSGTNGTLTPGASSSASTAGVAIPSCSGLQCIPNPSSADGNGIPEATGTGTALPGPSSTSSSGSLSGASRMQLEPSDSFVLHAFGMYLALAMGL